MFNLFHRQLFCLLDEWYGMTMPEIRAYEAQTKLELDEVFFFIHFQQTIQTNKITIPFLVVEKQKETGGSQEAKW